MAPHDLVQTRGVKCFQNTTSITWTSVSNKNFIFLYRWRRWISKFSFLFEISGNWTLHFPTLYATKIWCSWKTTSPCCRDCKNSNASNLFTINLLKFFMSSNYFFQQRKDNTKFKWQVSIRAFISSITIYDNVKIFCSLRYPWLKAYAQHKLDSKWKSCVYLRFLNKYYCHQCFDPTTSNVYISRDVIFETSYPYTNIFSKFKN